MIASASSTGTPAALGRSALRWVIGWWRIVHLGAVVLALALSPSSYRRDNRLALARQLYLDAAPILPWFTLLTALVSLVLIHIVVATALSYGLSRYALETLVRVLVLELIPLTAALFVALRCTIPNGAEIAELRLHGEFDGLRARGIDPLQREVLPRVAAGVFAVLALAAVSCAVALALAYVSLYGFTMGGFPAYTRRVGQIFTPAVALIFALKTLFLSLAVSLVPIASGLHRQQGTRWKTRAELQGLVRLFAIILLIEMAALVGNYY